MNRKSTIENLRIELEKLTIASRNIERAIRELEVQDQQQPVGQGASAVVDGPLDRDGNEIRIGYTIIFLTKGKFNATRGTVTRFSKNNVRVFASIENGTEVSRSPRNVRVVEK